MSRDPFPYPKLENDYSFTGARQQTTAPFDKPTHLAQNEEPWSRLNDNATLSSLRRSVMYFDREAPKDSLDFNLKSIYDHHQEFLRDKRQTLYQKETAIDDHGKHKSRKCEAPPSHKEKDVQVWVDSQKRSIYSIQGTIESHHNASTNRGYSRKHDGGFYCA
ncbi:cilia- and flagella-associated protein 276 [Aplochiton taeniatus]